MAQQETVNFGYPCKCVKRRNPLGSNHFDDNRLDISGGGAVETVIISNAFYKISAFMHFHVDAAISWSSPI